MDVLSEILDSIKFNTCLYFRADLNSPWGIRVPKSQNLVRFHIAIHGDFFLKVEGQNKDHKVHAGDIIFVSQGAEHSIYDSRESSVYELNQVIQMAEFTPGESLKFGLPTDTSSQIVCGHFSFTPENPHPFFKELPATIHYKLSESVEGVWLGQAVRFMDYEFLNKRPGDQSIIRRLAEIIFVQVIRSSLLKNFVSSTFLAALRDQYISRSLEAIHREPSQRWTLTSLAQTAGLSRSVFAERFRSVVGVPPMQYLTSWRMSRAKRLLEDRSMSISTVGESVGYNADEAFQKVFKKTFGLTPSQYRKELAKEKRSQ